MYAGHWLKPAREFLERHATDLNTKPIWLFSSGPIGDPAKPQEDPVDASSLVELTGARDHRVFAGKLDRRALNFGEKAIVMALRAPEGDFRDWNEIREWAAGIARTLDATPPRLIAHISGVSQLSWRPPRAETRPGPRHMRAEARRDAVRRRPPSALPRSVCSEVCASSCARCNDR